jgi:hypothetical protein
MGTYPVAVYYNNHKIYTNIHDIHNIQIYKYTQYYTILHKTIIHTKYTHTHTHSRQYTHKNYKHNNTKLQNTKQISKHKSNYKS